MKHGDMASAVRRTSGVRNHQADRRTNIDSWIRVGDLPRSLSNTQQVELAATSMAETAKDFNDNASCLMLACAPYELRINTGMVKPQTGFKAVINVSTDFLAQVPLALKSSFRSNFPRWR